jgi:4-amino-4-deoxy-L-arabinose transferase-like glycosyltransferase
MIALAMSPSRASPGALQMPRSRSPLRTGGLLLLVSLAVRLAFWGPVAGSGMSPMYDEGTYVMRAVGYGKVLSAVATGARPTETDRIWAYRDGRWPPLHPLLIGVAFAVFGPSVALARLVVAVQSALTTPVVYALTRRLADDRSALLAAVLHIVYPSFIAFSHLIWSETTYMLVCLAALTCVVRVVGEERLRRQLVWAALAGVLLGLAGLARAAALPLFVALPVWLAWRVRQRRRLLLPLVVLGAGLVTIEPWESTLWEREGQFRLLTTKSGYYLYEGNNPWFGQDRAKREMRAKLEEYAQTHDVSRDDAGRALAIEYIRSDIGGFLLRGAQRLRALVVPDWYVLRHVIYAAYPALPVTLAFVVLFSLTVSFVLLAACVVYGLWVGRTGLRHRSLLVACVLLSGLPSLVTIAFSRLTLPLLAILLPAAGVGLSRVVARRAWGRGLIAVVAATGALWLVNPRIPDGAFGARNVASSYYVPVVRCLERVFGARDTAAKDRILLRRVGDEVRGLTGISIRNDEYVFEFEDARVRDMAWTHRSDDDVIRLDIVAPRVPAEPPRLRLSRPTAGREATIQPVRPSAWRRWCPTGLAGIEYMWLGSAGIPDEQVAEWLGARAVPPGGA